MEATIKHIAFRLVSALIVVTLLMPVGIKLAHLFEHEEHTLCAKSDTANLHECEIDCPLFKYNLQQHYLTSQNYDVNFYLLHNFEIPALTYHFSYNHRVLAFSLRGPPALV